MQSIKVTGTDDFCKVIAPDGKAVRTWTFVRTGLKARLLTVETRSHVGTISWTYIYRAGAKPPEVPEDVGQEALLHFRKQMRLENLPE